MTLVNLMNTRDSVVARLAAGPLWIGDIKSPATTRELIRLQREGLVETFYRARGSKLKFHYRLKEGVIK